MRDIIKKIKDNEILLKGSSAFLFKVLGSCLGYFFLLLVTRSSGAEAWGIFVLAMALLNIVSIVSRFGVDIALLKFVAQLKDRIPEIKGVYLQGLSFVLFLSFILSVSLYFFSDQVAEFVFHKPHLSPYFKMISFALVPFSIIHLNAQTFRGLKRIKEFAFYSYTSQYFFAVLAFLFLSFLNIFEDFFVAIYSFITAAFIVMLLTSISLSKRLKGTVIKLFSKRHIIKTAFPMMMSASILLLIAWADTIMIAIYKTEVDVGIYNVAFKLAMVGGIILGAVNSIVAPKLSETYNNKQLVDFKIIIKQASRIIFFFTLPVLLILILFPKFFLSFFGPEFIIAKNTLFILLIGQIVNASCGSVGNILQMTGKEKVVQNILFFALLINILLNVILIPRFGYLGAALSSSFSVVFWNLTMVFYVKKYYNIYSFIH